MDAAVRPRSRLFSSPADFELIVIRVSYSLSNVGHCPDASFTWWRGLYTGGPEFSLKYPPSKSALKAAHSKSDSANLLATSSLSPSASYYDTKDVEL